MSDAHRDAALRARSDQVLLNGRPVEQNFTRGPFNERRDDFHGGRFARAVRPQVAGDSAGARGEADVVDRDDSAEALRNVTKLSSLCSILLRDNAEDARFPASPFFDACAALCRRPICSSQCGVDRTVSTPPYRRQHLLRRE